MDQHHTFVPFLRDLAVETLTSKTDVMLLAAYLGMKSLISTVNPIFERNQDVKAASSEFLFSWSESDTIPIPEKLEKLKQAYHYMKKPQPFLRVLEKYPDLSSGVQASGADAQVELAAPIVDQISSEVKTQAFLIELLRHIVTQGQLRDMAIDCGIPLNVVDSHHTNWPRNITQAVLEVMLDWWETSGGSEREKFETLRAGFYSMKKPAVFMRVAEDFGIPVDDQGNVSSTQPQTVRDRFGIEMRNDDGSAMGVTVTPVPQTEENQGPNTVGTGHYARASQPSNLRASQTSNSRASQPSDAMDMDTEGGLELGGAAGYSIGASQAAQSREGSNPSSRVPSSRVHHRQRSAPNRESSSNMLDIGTLRSRLENLTIGPAQGSLGPNNQSTEISTSYPYDNGKRPAKVLIFNNVCEETKYGYHSGLRMPGRQEQATNQLKDHCLAIGYDVDYFKDIDKHEMIRLKDDLQTFDFGGYNMFLCVIVCHGNEADTLLDCKKELALKFNDYVQSVIKNQSLFGKPKIFFKMACRGGELDDGIFSLSGDGFGLRHLPKEADVAIAYPTAQGYLYLLNTEGDQLTPIEALSRLLEEETLKRPRRLNTLFLRWKRMLSETVYKMSGDATPYKQTPSVYDTLRDEVYF